MLNQFGSDIWYADGPDITAMMGFRYSTRMVVIRLSDDRLFVWSPVEFNSSLGKAVGALGKVSFLVAPNSLHHMFLPEWIKAYPEALVYAAPGLRQKRPDIHFHDDLAETPADNWQGEIDQVMIKGNKITTEVVFFHIKSGTVLFTDLIQHFPTGWFKGWRAVIAKLDFMMEAEPAVPRKFRWAFRDRVKAREAVKQIQTWPAEKVLIAHGTPVFKEGKAFISRAFDWL